MQFPVAFHPPCPISTLPIETPLFFGYLKVDPRHGALPLCPYKHFSPPNLTLSPLSFSLHPHVLLPHTHTPRFSLHRLRVHSFQKPRTLFSRPSDHPLPSLLQTLALLLFRNIPRINPHSSQNALLLRRCCCRPGCRCCCLRRCH